MPIINAKEFGDAASALKEWFKSQNIEPHESVQVMSYFIAAMSYSNANDWADIERKLTLVHTSSTEFARLFHAMKAIP